MAAGKGRSIDSCQVRGGRHLGRGTKVLPTKREGTKNNAHFKEGEGMKIA